MKQVVVTLALLAAASAAQAQSRPDTRRMSCVQARALVQARGAVVLSTGDNTYDRYVATQQSCNKDEITVPAYVRTTDYTGCHVGYTCQVPTGGRR
jgi:hypothetical protein